MNSSVEDPNLGILTATVRALGDLARDVVLVGGCATGQLVTDVRAQAIRPTADVDIVIQVTTRLEYALVERRLERLGFAHDLSDRAPICRWDYHGLSLDLLPSNAGILDFHNRWYPLAIETATPLVLQDDLRIRLITAPVFVATKLEAFKARGARNYLGSHDLEDIVTIVDGRAVLLAETESHPSGLRQYLGEAFAGLLRDEGFRDSLAGHLPSDRASQAHLPRLIERLESIARFA